MSAKTPKQIAQFVQMACILEASAPKPGNVNRHHDFADTTLGDFLASAVAIGPAFEATASCSVGMIVRNAIESTREWVQSNTNLGMVLLLAPLAKAALGAVNVDQIRIKLRGILRSLTVEDSHLAYAAIRNAKPGGLGHVEESDVTVAPSIALLEAMALAQGRDSIAREYVTDYAITFEIGLPAMMEALQRRGDMPSAIVQTYLTILAAIPDTLIARKEGAGEAHRVSQLANAVLAKGGVFEPEGKRALTEMDLVLRDDRHRLNPGTSADLTAAVIFLAIFSGKF